MTSVLLKDKKLWWSLVALAVICGLAVIALAQPQCPDDYSHEQAQLAGCNQGGLGVGFWLVLILAGPTLLTAVGLIIYTTIRDHRNQRGQKPSQPPKKTT